MLSLNVVSSLFAPRGRSLLLAHWIIPARVKITTTTSNIPLMVRPNARSMSALCLGLMIILNLLSYVLDFIAVVTATHMVHSIGDGGMVAPHEDASLGVGVTA